MATWNPRVVRGHGSFYLAIAEALLRDVREGRLSPGTRLPTQRELARRLRCTVGTVTRAYLEARRRGLVTGEVGRGTFVRALAPAATPTSADALRAGVADLARNQLPTTAAAGLVRDALEALREPGRLEALLPYQPALGTERHREAGARWFAARGLDASPEEVVVTGGAHHGLLLSLSQIAEAGDLVLTESLTHQGMRSLARFLHLRLEGVAIDHEGLVPESFAAACRRARPKALVVTPTLHNPTATTLSAARRERIGALAAEFGVTVIENDVYGFLATESPPPLATFCPHGAYVVSSLSKVVAPSLRVGFVRPPKAALPGVLASVVTTSLMASPLTAELAATLVLAGDVERLAAGHRDFVAARQSLLRRHLGARVARGSDSAAPHAWIDLPAPWRHEEAVAHARLRGLSVASTDLFAVPPAVPPAALRLCLGSIQDDTTFEHAAATLATLLARDPPPDLVTL